LTRIRFSSRTPRRLTPNRPTSAREAIGDIVADLGISNPTRCGLPYPDDLLAPLADPAGLDYQADPRGPLTARQAIAESCRRQGAEVDPGSIVLTASTSEAYSFLFKLLCDPGDTVLVPTPSYPLLNQLSRLDAVTTHSFDLRADDDWRIDAASLTAAPESTRAIILVHPNNPTGNHVHPDDAAAIRALSRERGWALIVDEVFLPFTLDGGPGSETTFAASTDCLTFTLGGLSKSIGLPQLKLAWIVAGGPEDHVSAALERLDYITDAYLSVSTPVALAAARLVSSADALQHAIAERCRANLATLRRAAVDHPAVSVPRVGGGWSVVVRLPAVLDDEEFTLRLLAEERVAVQPGFFFDLPYDSALVLSLITPEATWRRGLDAIFEAVENLI
jgi:hypothetical protein